MTPTVELPLQRTGITETALSAEAGCKQLSIPLFWNDWRKQNTATHKTLLQTQMLLVQLIARSLTGSGRGLWLKGAGKHSTLTWSNKECVPSLGPTALPAPGLQPQLSSCSPLMIGLYYSQNNRNNGKAVLWEALDGLEHTTPVDALRRENCQSPSHFRNKHLPRDEPHPAAPNTKPACPEFHTTSPTGNQPKIAANPPAACTKEEQQAQWVSKPQMDTQKPLCLC